MKLMKQSYIAAIKHNTYIFCIDKFAKQYKFHNEHKLRFLPIEEYVRGVFVREDENACKIVVSARD